MCCHLVDTEGSNWLKPEGGGSPKGPANVTVHPSFSGAPAAAARYRREICPDFGADIGWKDDHKHTKLSNLS